MSVLRAEAMDNKGGEGGGAAAFQLSDDADRHSGGFGQLFLRHAAAEGLEPLSGGVLRPLHDSHFPS
ncbi:hypothetical protein GCM10010245_12160 [Streptomyces spectabilis]|nr:hypothetical protein GCM10010245_12160 [Streptomyces spectabilis]